MSRHLPTNSLIPVAGVSFRQDAVRSVTEGQQVRMVADPSNPHDEDAIAVLSDRDTLLGYVPAGLTARLHATGHTAFAGAIDEVLRGDTWGLRVRYDGPCEDDRRPPGHVDRAAATDTPAPTTTDDVDDRVVRTRSGRVLGAYGGVEGKHTLVVLDGGAEVRYPTAVVEVAERVTT